MAYFGASQRWQGENHPAPGRASGEEELMSRKKKPRRSGKVLLLERKVLDEGAPSQRR